MQYRVLRLGPIKGNLSCNYPERLLSDMVTFRPSRLPAKKRSQPRTLRSRRVFAGSLLDRPDTVPEQPAAQLPIVLKDGDESSQAFWNQFVRGESRCGWADNIPGQTEVDIWPFIVDIRSFQYDEEWRVFYGN